MPKPTGRCDVCQENATGMAKRGLFFMIFCENHRAWITAHVYGTEVPKEINQNKG